MVQMCTMFMSDPKTQYKIKPMSNLCVSVSRGTVESEPSAALGVGPYGTTWGGVLGLVPGKKEWGPICPLHSFVPGFEFVLLGDVVLLGARLIFCDVPAFAADETAK